MRAHALQLASHFDVVTQRVLGPVRVQNIARVTDSRLANAAGLQHGIHRHLHVRKPVQRIEDTEDINALPRRFGNKLAHQVIRICRVTHRIRSTQKHLKTDIWNRFAEPAQPLPRIFQQKPHRHVKGRAAPHFEAVQSRQAARDIARDRFDVMRANPCRQQ